MNKSIQEEERKGNEKKASEKQKFVLYSEYMQLKQKFEKQKIKNREMSQLIESMNKSIIQITNSHSSINAIYNTLVKVDEIKQYLNPSSSNQSKEKPTEFSLKADSESNFSHNKQKSHNIEKDLKKLEELEFFLSDMSKNYNYIVLKYKYMKLDKDKAEELIIKYTNENGKLNETVSNIENEIKRLENIIEKQKKTEKCLIHSISNTFAITDRTDVIVKQKENEIGKTLVEPIPSFLKFMK